MTKPGIFLLAVMFLVVGCGGASSASEEAAESPQPGLRVETLVLAPDTFEDVIELTGAIASLNDASLSAQAAGTVQMIAPLGKSVQEGEVVARLDQGFAQAALEQASAQVENTAAGLDLARDNFNRQEPLFQDSIISALEFHQLRTQLQQAEASVRQAMAQEAQAREQVEYTLLAAPFSGSIEAHSVERGEQVAPGMPVLRIVDTRRVKVSVGVPERYAGDIDVGTEILLDVQAYRGASRRGRVTFSGSAINPSNRTFLIEAEVDNANGRLKPEMIAEVFVTRERLDSVLVVPRSAVLRDESGSSVFVVRQEEDFRSAEQRSVVLGPAYSGLVIVADGLIAGDEVVVLGQTTLTDGDIVEVVSTYSGLDQAGVPIE